MLVIGHFTLGGSLGSSINAMCYAFSTATYSCLHNMRAGVAVSGACVYTSPFGGEEFGQPVVDNFIFQEAQPSRSEQKV